MNTIIEKIRAEVLRLIKKSPGPGSQYGFGMMSACNRILNFLDTLKEQPVEWSEKDEDMIQDIIASIDTNIATSDFHEMENWLKSLRPQPKQEHPVCEGLEEEIQNQIYNHFFDLNGIAITGTTAYATVEDMVYIAKLFYELGKEEKPTFQEQPICEELGREMDRFFTSEEYEEAKKAGFGEAHTARHFAKWGAEHLATPAK